MADHHLEVEQKFEITDVGRPAPQPVWSFDRWQAREPALEELAATYYDTAAGDLGKNKVALRRRLGGYDEGWHIKFDAADARHEVSFTLLAHRATMPAAVKKFVRVAAAGQEPQPRVSLNTRRLRTVITDAQGTPLAEICDDTVTAQDLVTGQERTWHEWEVELLEGVEPRSDEATHLFEEIGAVLKKVGAEPSSSPAKLVRALGQDAAYEARLAIHREQQEKPGTPPAPSKKAAKKKKKAVASRAEEPADLPNSVQLVERIMSRLVGQLVQADLLIQVGAPDSTHRGRVAARALRSVLKYMVAPYTRTDAVQVQVAGLMKGLAAYARQLERHRNGELVYPMARQGFAEYGLLTKQENSAFEACAEQADRSALKEAQCCVQSASRLDLHLGLLALIEELPQALDLPLNSENYLNKVAKRLRKNLVKQAERTVSTWPQRASDFSESTTWDEGLHDIRKAAKAARYCLSACSEAGLPLTKAQFTLLTRAKALQSELGVLTDELTLSHWLATLRPQATGAGLNAYALGHLAGRSDFLAVGLRMDIYASLPKALKKMKALKLV